MRIRTAVSASLLVAALAVGTAACGSTDTGKDKPAMQETSTPGGAMSDGAMSPTPADAMSDGMSDGRMSDGADDKMSDAPSGAMSPAPGGAMSDGSSSGASNGK